MSTNSLGLPDKTNSSSISNNNNNNNLCSIEKVEKSNNSPMEPATPLSVVSFYNHNHSPQSQPIINNNTNNNLNLNIPPNQNEASPIVGPQSLSEASTIERSRIRTNSSYKLNNNTPGSGSGSGPGSGSGSGSVISYDELVEGGKKSQVDMMNALNRLADGLKTQMNVDSYISTLIQAVERINEALKTKQGFEDLSIHPSRDIFAFPEHKIQALVPTKARDSNVANQFNFSNKSNNNENNNNNTSSALSTIDEKVTNDNAANNNALTLNNTNNNNTEEASEIDNDEDPTDNDILSSNNSTANLSNNNNNNNNNNSLASNGLPPTSPTSSSPVLSGSNLNSNALTVGFGSSGSSGLGSGSTLPLPLSSPVPAPLPSPTATAASSTCPSHILSDIAVVFSNQKSKVPPGFTLIEKSLSNHTTANLNKNGSKKVYLAYKKGNTDQTNPLPPITSFSIIFRDMSEEPPYGFIAINKSAKGFDANLNVGSPSNRNVKICVFRGEGAPIQDIGVHVHDNRSSFVLPGGWHEVRQTPFGNKADLSASSTNSNQSPESATPIFIAFKPDVSSLMNSFNPPLIHIQDSVYVSYSRVLASLVACLYSYDAKIVLHSFECFRKMTLTSIPPQLINKYIIAVCDASPVFLTYFTTQGHSATLKFLQFIFVSCLPILSLNTVMKLVELAFLIRHEDKANEVTESFITTTIAHIQITKPCKCHTQDDTTSNNNTSDKFNLTNSSSSINNTFNSNITNSCFKCLRAQSMSHLPVNEYMQCILNEISTNVTVASHMEGLVKAFQRHPVTNVHWRKDVATVLYELANFDQKDYIERELINSKFINNNELNRSSSSLKNKTSDVSILSSPIQSPWSALAYIEYDRTLPMLDRCFLNNNHSSSSQNSTHSTSPTIEHKNIFTLSAILLTCCKFASEYAPFGLKKSETIKRKLHGLRLMLFTLQRTGFLYRQSRGLVFLLRRFVCPSLMNAAVTDDLQVFRCVLQIFTVLYDRFRNEVMIELGAFLDHIFLSFLESATVSNEMKKDILDVFIHILAPAQSVINLYYNYDNHAKTWNIFERLTLLLSKIIDGELRYTGGINGSIESMTAPGNNNNISPSPSPNANNATNNNNSNPSASPSINDPSLESLQKHALRLLVHIMHMQCEWLGVPGLKRDPSILAPPHLVDEDGDATIVNSDGSISINSNANTNNHITYVEESNVPLNTSRVSRTNTWSKRFDKQKADQKIIHHALKLAKTEKLKSALQYLKIVSPTSALPSEMAKFLYHNDSLDKTEVGEILSTGEDKFMSHDEYEALRWEYLSLLDFTGMSFSDSVRLYLCDSGFRLPGESQRIDRLLEVFCKAFCRDNPGVFRNSSSAFIVAFALVMLNTELHDPRLKAGKNPREPMTLEQFISNLRGVDDGNDFSRPFLEQLYLNIKENAIEWKGDLPGVDPKKDEKEKIIPSPQEVAMQARKNTDLLVRRAIAFLKNQSAYQQGFNTIIQTAIVSGMYEVSWFRCIAAITARSENTLVKDESDVDVLHLCLDGLAYGATMAVVLGLPTERQAFTRQLAKICFLEKNRDSQKSANLPVRIVIGDHLKQDWYRPLNLQSEKHPSRACRVIFGIAEEIKQKISYERRQAVLRKIQGEFGGEICLVDSSRSFVKEGKLTKVNTSNGKRVPYHFFLFNDLILYASEGMQSRYFKVHRVVHLSLCRLEDLQSISIPHAFRIVSPQKSFVVSAPSAEKKKSWIDAILFHLTRIMEVRAKWIKDATIANPSSPKSTPLQAPNGANLILSAANSSVNNNSTSNSNLTEDDDILRRYSTFIGQSGMDLTNTKSSFSTASGLGAANAAALAINHCKLCIRPFSLFRRKAKCRWCMDVICSECCTQKAVIPSVDKRLHQVCDACFGALKGMVGAEVKLITTVDC